MKTPSVKETGKAAEVARFAAAERWIVKKLRTWLDRADEVLHRWEVASRGAAVPVAAVAGAEAQTAQETESKWERPPIVSTRKIARAPKKRRMTAAEFDLDIRMRSAARAGAQ